MSLMKHKIPTKNVHHAGIRYNIRTATTRFNMLFQFSNAPTKTFTDEVEARARITRFCSMNYMCQWLSSTQNLR
ncbi:hypothetical protein EV1_021457 [Malus domestica]